MGGSALQTSEIEPFAAPGLGQGAFQKENSHVNSPRSPSAPPPHNNPPARTSLTAQFARAATSPAAKAVYVTVGTLGLAALAIGIFGPRRFQRQILHPAGR